MKFSRICLGLLLISSFNVLIATPQRTSKRFHFSKFSGKAGERIRVEHGSKLRDGELSRMSGFGTMVNQLKDKTRFINIIFLHGHNQKSKVSLNRHIYKDHDRFFIRGQFPYYPGVNIKYKGATYQASDPGRGDHDPYATHRFKFIPLPQGINNALKSNDTVKLEFKFYENNAPGAYKLFNSKQPYGSFDILLADNQPETPQPPSETPTPTEQPTADQREGQNVQQQFQTITNEIAELKQMINQLMDKMQK